MWWQFLNTSRCSCCSVAVVFLGIISPKYSLYLYLYKYKILVWTFHIPNFELTNEARAEDKLACTMPCKEEVDEVNCNTATLQRFF